MAKFFSKFGLKRCDLPTMVSITTMFLKVLAINLDPCQDKIPKLSYIFTITVFSCYVYVYIFSMAWFVFWRCPQTGDVIRAVVIFALGLSSEISTVKFLYMFFNQKTLRDIVREYLSYDSKADPTSRFSRKVLEVLRRVKKTATTFWIIVIGNGMIYCVKPLLLPGRHLMEDTEFLFGLEPLFISPNYEIGYIVTLNACIFTVYATANVSAFFIIFTGYIEAQLLSLSDEILNIWDDAQNYFNQTYNIEFGDQAEIELRDRDLILNKYIKDHLPIIVKKHITNIYFLGKMEDVFRNSIGIEFGLLMISLIAEFLGGIENTYLMMPFALVQVTMDCITGQKLLDASNLFQRAVYDCKWENFNASNMKTVFLILMNSQKDMTLSVGGLRTLSYLCLMDVFRMIYSTYTTLRSTLDR